MLSRMEGGGLGWFKVAAPGERQTMIQKFQEAVLGLEPTSIPSSRKGMEQPKCHLIMMAGKK